MVRRLITLFVALGLAGAAAWAMWPRPVAVETAVIARQDIELTVEEEGKSRIREVFTVSAPSAGQMLRVNLHAGDEVVRGMTIVASIKPADPGLLDARSRGVAEATTEAARAAVDLAAAEVRQAEAQVVFLNGELDRATALIRHGTISERAFQKAQLDARSAEASLERTKAMLMVRKRELERAEAALIESSGSGGNTCCIDVRTPVSGRILRVLTESEQVVQAGTPLLEIGDPRDIEIVVDLLSRDAVQIKPGAPAAIENWGGEPIAARVSRVDPSAVTKVSALGIEEQRVTTVLTLAESEAKPEALGHGFRVVAKIMLWKGEGLIAVPIGALFRRGTDWAVFVTSDGKARLTVLELGVRNGAFAEVKSGLTEGDTVVVHPSDQVADGAAVSTEPGN